MFGGGTVALVGDREVSPDSREGSEVRRSFQGKTKDEVPAIGVANDENACKVFGHDFFRINRDSAAWQGRVF